MTRRHRFDAPHTRRAKIEPKPSLDEIIGGIHTRRLPGALLPAALKPKPPEQPKKPG